jgi:4-hydroxy-tetrahydrodipicolinate reductase
MIKIAVTGVKGRVGQMVIQTIKEDPSLQLQLAAELARQDLADRGQNRSEAIDVVIDFSHPSALTDLLSLCCERAYRLVIGTTGFTDAQKQQIREAATLIPIVLAPNMSVGINISYKLLEMAAKILKDQPVDIAILDIHHKHKKDAPSGTALRMGEVIATAQAKSVKEAKIDFSPLRLGDIVGEHTAIFALEGERIEISHKSTNRSLYAKGALKAAQWLMDKPPGLYDMQDVLGL